jgi:hypothetical protein
MTRFSTSIAFAVGLIAAVVFAGCGQSLETELGLQYASPNVPSDVPETITPSPDSRTSNLLAEGQTTLNLHQYYRSMHRTGWRWAIDDRQSGRPYRYKTEDDVKQGLDALGCGQDAFWLGYKDAIDQIAAAEKSQNQR